MKMKLLALLFIISAAGGLQAGTEAGASTGLRIASPDHPATWEVGFNDKVGQSLRWSESEGRLLLDVTYSRITYTDTIPPSDFRTYTLVFPGVSLDGDGNFFVLNNQKQKIVIGCWTKGPFGKQVTLNRGFSFSAHRQNGRINAMILANNAR
jgi:hypothetical protein